MYYVDPKHIMSYGDSKHIMALVDSKNIMSYVEPADLHGKQKRLMRIFMFCTFCFL